MSKKPDHPLRAYRDRERIPAREFADRCGVTRMTLWRIENRKCDPSMRLVARIVAETGGNVRADDFLPPEFAA